MTNQKIAVHQKTFAIAWSDMDALGHVNNARYLAKKFKSTLFAYYIKFNYY